MDILAGHSERFRHLIAGTSVPWQAMALEISHDASLTSELKMLKNKLGRVTEKGQVEGIQSELRSHTEEYPMLDLPDEAWDSLWSSYKTILGRFSVPIIREAFAMWKRGEMYPKDPGRHEFFPTAQELEKLCSQAMVNLLVISHRAKKALELCEEETDDETELKARQNLGEAL